MKWALCVVSLLTTSAHADWISVGLPMIPPPVVSRCDRPGWQMVRRTVWWQEVRTVWIRERYGWRRVEVPVWFSRVDQVLEWVE